MSKKVVAIAVVALLFSISAAAFFTLTQSPSTKILAAILKTTKEREKFIASNNKKIPFFTITDSIKEKSQSTIYEGDFSLELLEIQGEIPLVDEKFAKILKGIAVKGNFQNDAKNNDTDISAAINLRYNDLLNFNIRSSKEVFSVLVPSVSPLAVSVQPKNFYEDFTASSLQKYANIEEGNIKAAAAFLDALYAVKNKSNAQKQIFERLTNAIKTIYLSSDFEKISSSNNKTSYLVKPRKDVYTKEAKGFLDYYFSTSEHFNAKKYEYLKSALYEIFAGTLQIEILENGAVTAAKIRILPAQSSDYSEIVLSFDNQIVGEYSFSINAVSKEDEHFEINFTEYYANENYILDFSLKSNIGNINSSFTAHNNGIVEGELDLDDGFGLIFSGNATEKGKIASYNINKITLNNETSSLSVGFVINLIETDVKFIAPLQSVLVQDMSDTQAREFVDSYKNGMQKILLGMAFSLFTST